MRYRNVTKRNSFVPHSGIFKFKSDAMIDIIIDVMNIELYHLNNVRQRGVKRKKDICMDSPQTINGLMRHLRNECNIQIQGSKQKQQLISYGYYHGYKGYRFFQNSNNQLPYTDFSEVVAVIEYDNNLKAALYPNLMFMETAVKNIVCNETVNGLRYATFDYVFKERMNDNPSNAALQLSRLQLRNSVYSKLSSRYRDESKIDNKMIRHFYNRGEDAPLWVIFETLYLSDLASFFSCLNTIDRERILAELNMLDISIDTKRELLTSMLFTLKALRNSVAHNSVIYDTRFKDRAISPVLKKWAEKETGIQNISLYSIIDYIIILCCLLKRIDFTGVRAKNLLKVYKTENVSLQKSVSPAIYNMLFQQNVTAKIALLEIYLNS